MNLFPYNYVINWGTDEKPSFSLPMTQEQALKIVEDWRHTDSPVKTYKVTYTLVAPLT